MNIKDDKKKLYISIGLVVFGLISFFFLSSIFSSPDMYKNLIDALDDKKTNVLGLTAAMSAASIAITALPGDIATPVASQLSSLSGYLLAILSVIYLEKYLLTIIGYFAFRYIIPGICILLIIWIYNNNETLYKTTIKIILFVIAILVVTPTSVKLSQMIDETYQNSINETIDVASSDIEIEQQEEVVITQDNQDKKWYEKIADKFSETIDDVKSGISTSTSETANKLKDKLNSFIEATAVMIVTSCLIPIATLLLMYWLVKTLFGVEFKHRKPKDNTDNKIQQD